MNKYLSCALLIFFLALSAESSSSYAAMDWSGAMFSSIVHYRNSGAGEICDELSGECKENMDEFLSDMTRRSLAGKRYISYKALRQNAVPCNVRGRSYYNCGAAGKVNPYSRGCSVITRCARLYE
ncbi:hypothetical protein HRI_004003500 [Hibiscus trionum]|uniref:Rapid alkalinization factor n=1 Tax=Hibiscus trionum TaxID=183268 RepID=A0A9W7IYS5_HIBTR|nr:hypothetical protein HRI_004003500 [Hibiscus trionum]